MWCASVGVGECVGGHREREGRGGSKNEMVCGYMYMRLIKHDLPSDPRPGLFDEGCGRVEFVIDRLDRSKHTSTHTHTHTCSFMYKHGCSFCFFDVEDVPSDMNVK